MILSSFLLGSSVHSNQESSSGMPTIRLHIVERDLIVGSLVLDAMRQLNLLASSSSSSSSNHQTSLVSLEEQNIAKQLARCLTMEQGGGVSVLNRLRISCSTSCVSSSQDGSTQSTINNEASTLSLLQEVGKAFVTSRCNISRSNVPTTQKRTRYTYDKHKLC